MLQVSNTSSLTESVLNGFKELEALKNLSITMYVELVRASVNSTMVSVLFKLVGYKRL